MKVRGLLFDLGGTLFSYSRRGGMGKAIFDTAEMLGINAEPQEIGTAWGQANETTMRRYAKMDYFLHRDLFLDTLTNFAERFERTVDDEVAGRFEAAQRQAVIDHLPIREECSIALQALKERGLYLAIVSNIDDDYLDPLVSKHKLHNWLDHCTTTWRAPARLACALCVSRRKAWPPRSPVG